MACYVDPKVEFSKTKWALLALVSALPHTKKKTSCKPKSTASFSFRSLQLEYTKKKTKKCMGGHKTLTQKKTPEYARILLASKHLPHDLHFTCQVVNCHCHWRYAQCQGRVQDLQAEEARHGGNNQPRVQHGPTACYGCYGDLLMPYEKHSTLLMASSGWFGGWRAVSTKSVDALPDDETQCF